MALAFDPTQLTIASSDAFESYPEPDMTLLTGKGNYPPPTFPLAILPTELQQWVIATAEGSNAPVDYPAISLLVHAASLVGNTLSGSPWPSWVEPSILWAGLIGLPSSGKSPSQVSIDQAMNTVEQELQRDYPEQLKKYKKKLIMAKAIEKEWKRQLAASLKPDSDNPQPPPMPDEAYPPDKPICPILAVMDATIEKLAYLLDENPRGLLQKRDELDGWLYSMGRYSGNADAEKSQWKQAFNSKLLKVHRVKLEDPITVPRASLSVIGTIQPDKVRLITCGHNDGLSARFLYIWPDPVPSKRPVVVSDPNQLIRLFNAILKLPLGNTPRVIPLTDEAASLFEGYWLQLNTAIEEASGHYGAFIGKQPGYVIRLALVLEVLQWATHPVSYQIETISIASVESAICLSRDYLIPMARRVFADSNTPDDAFRTDAMVDWIITKRPTLINKRHVYRDAKIEGIKSAKDADHVIKELMEARWLIHSPSRSGGSTGKQKADYLVNPRVWPIIDGYLERNR